MAPDPAAPRALIVGCGRIAGGFNEDDETAVLTHVVAYRRAGAQVVGCVDADPEAARRFARRWSVALSGDDLAAVVRESRPEVVSLCTPPQERLAPLRVLLEAPSVRSVLVEKPLALGAAEAQEMAALAAQRGRALLVNFFRAYDPFYLEVERACRAGELGPLCAGTAHYYGTALANASHLIERLLAMFGPPSAVRRLGGSVEEPRFELDWKGAAVVFVPAAGCRYSPVELDLLFEGRRLRIIDSEGRAEAFQAGPHPRYPGFLTLVPDPVPPPGAPSPEAILGAVRAALAAAGEAGPAAGPGPRTAWAVGVVRILEQLGVGSG